jgi:hypothetical protein
MFNTINSTIITTLGIDKLPVEQQNEALEKSGAIVYQEVMLRALEEMSDEDKDAFEKLLESNPTPEIMFGFLSEKVPTIDSIAKEEAEKFIADSKEIMGTE